MSHRVIIISKIAEAFASPEVREEMTAQQCQNVDSILACEEPTPSQVRELTHRLNRVYSADD